MVPASVGDVLLHEIVDVSARVAATRSRKEKTGLIADLLTRTEPAQRELVATYVSGRLRQRRTGLGWRGLQALPPPADDVSLGVAEADAAFEHLASLAGPGSVAARAAAVVELFGRATAPEQEWLRAVALGNVRQGALEAVMTEGVAAAAGVPVADVRRAAMLAGSATHVVDAAFAGPDALAAIGLTVGRPIQPMLASSAPDLDAALVKIDGELAVDAKLDGIRIQVHRRGDDVLIATRSLDDITHRLPEVVDVVRGLAASEVVLDGEAIALDQDGRPGRSRRRPPAPRRRRTGSPRSRRTSSTCCTSTAATCSTSRRPSAGPRWTPWCPSSTGCRAGVVPTRRQHAHSRSRCSPTAMRASWSRPRRRRTPPAGVERRG